MGFMAAITALKTAMDNLSTAVTEAIKRTTNNIQGDPGQVLFVSERNTPGAVEAGEIFNQGVAIAMNSTEASNSRVVKQSFAEAFNQWTRISHSNSDVQPALPEELDAWTYDATNDQILSDINSSSLVGFISPDSYDDYIFEVTCKSTNGDDDYIGICLAAVMEGGKRHLLYVLLNVGADTDADGKMEVLAGTGISASHAGNKLIASHNFGKLASKFGKDGWMALTKGWRLKATRKGNQFTVVASAPNSTSFDSKTTLSFNLNDDPVLAKYKGACQFGYVAHSQPQATWVTHRRPGASTPVYDISTKQYWTMNDAGAWVAESGVEANAVLKPGRFYHNENQKSLFYVNKDGGVTKVALS